MAAGPERLELGVRDLAVVTDLDLKLDDVPATRLPDDRSADLGE